MAATSPMAIAPRTAPTGQTVPPENSPPPRMTAATLISTKLCPEVGSPDPAWALSANPPSTITTPAQPYIVSRTFSGLRAYCRTDRRRLPSALICRPGRLAIMKAQAAAARTMISRIGSGTPGNV